MSETQNHTNQTWSAIILCYNEEETIEWAVRTVRKTLSEITSGSSEVIVINDGSTDTSGTKLERLQIEFPELRVVTHERNRGIGAALRSGYEAAKMENLVVLPADGEFDVNELKAVKSFDDRTVISFYRKKKTGYNWFRKFISRVNNYILRNVLDVHVNDINFIKVFKTREVQSLDLRMNSLLLVSEVCAKLSRSGNRIVEIESTYQTRKGGSSKGASALNIFRPGREVFKLIREVRRYPNLRNGEKG